MPISRFSTTSTTIHTESVYGVYTAMETIHKAYTPRPLTLITGFMTGFND